MGDLLLFFFDLSRDLDLDLRDLDLCERLSLDLDLDLSRELYLDLLDLLSDLTGVLRSLLLRFSGITKRVQLNAKHKKKLNAETCYCKFL